MADIVTCSLSLYTAATCCAQVRRGGQVLYRCTSVVGFVGVRSPRIDDDFVEGSVHANTSTLGGWADGEILAECVAES